MNNIVSTETKIIKPMQELANIANQKLFFTLIKYDIEKLKNMEDENGLTFLHYFFLIRANNINHYNSASYEEVNFLIDNDFNFKQQSKNNNLVSIDHKTHEVYVYQDYRIGFTTPFHLLVKYISDFSRIDFKEIHIDKLDLHTEDSLGLTAFIYAIYEKWINYINFISLESTNILTEKLKDKKEYILKSLDIIETEQNKEVIDLCRTKIEKETLDELFIHNDEQLKDSKIIKI